jgi:hypothetical protein
MKDLSRRDAFKTIVGGATGVALASGAVASPIPDSGMIGPTDASLPRMGPAPSAGLAEEIQAAAERLSVGPMPGPGAVMGWARVLLIRSWSREVYLFINESTRGFASVSEAGLAIAAACRAADRPVAAAVWGQEPNFAGVGRFAGALLAMDAADLSTGASNA